MTSKLIISVIVMSAVSAAAWADRSKVIHKRENSHDVCKRMFKTYSNWLDDNAVKIDPNTGKMTVNANSKALVKAERIGSTYHVTQKTSGVMMGEEIYTLDANDRVISHDLNTSGDHIFAKFDYDSKGCLMTEDSGFTDDTNAKDSVYKTKQKLIWGDKKLCDERFLPLLNKITDECKASVASLSSEIRKVAAEYKANNSKVVLNSSGSSILAISSFCSDYIDEFLEKISGKDVNNTAINFKKKSATNTDAI